MNWININDNSPLCYKTGDWDGKQSDRVIVEDISGEYYVAISYSGHMDGSHFSVFYDRNDNEISNVVRWFNIPE
jgi:hypothetical protein